MAKKDKKKKTKKDKGEKSVDLDSDAEPTSMVNQGRSKKDKKKKTKKISPVDLDSDAEPTSMDNPLSVEIPQPREKDLWDTSPEPPSVDKQANGSSNGAVKARPAPTIPGSDGENLVDDLQEEVSYLKGQVKIKEQKLQRLEDMATMQNDAKLKQCALPPVSPLPTQLWLDRASAARTCPG